MRGLLKGERGKSTLEFAVGQSRFETALRLFGSKSERNWIKAVHVKRSSFEQSADFVYAELRQHADSGGVLNENLDVSIL
jgi:hypothetical protein